MRLKQFPLFVNNSKTPGSLLCCEVCIEIATKFIQLSIFEFFKHYNHNTEVKKVGQVNKP